MRTLNTGRGSFAVLTSVRWVAPADGQALKRLRRAREVEGKVVDLTGGRAAVSFVGLENGELIVSSVSAKALQRRISKRSERAEEESLV